MTTGTRWLLGTAAAAVGVYALMWIGYLSGWTWLVAMDSAALDVAYRYGVDAPGLGDGLGRVLHGAGAERFSIGRPGRGRRGVVAPQLASRGVPVDHRRAVGTVVELAKYIADRPRPATALVFAQSSSFPSGHALGVMVGVLVVLTIVWPFVNPPLRAWLIALGALIVVMIGVGRVVLNVHHPSDVIAGWALGYAYFVVCVCCSCRRAAGHGSGRNTGSTRYRTLKLASVHSVLTSPSWARIVEPSTALNSNSGTRIS